MNEVNKHIVRTTKRDDGLYNGILSIEILDTTKDIYVYSGVISIVTKCLTRYEARKFMNVRLSNFVYLHGMALTITEFKELRNNKYRYMT